MLNLDSMNKTEMLAAADEMMLKVPSSSTKAEVRKLLAGELQARAAKEQAEAEEGRRKIPTEQGEPLTVEQLEKLRAASDDKIRGVLDDPGLTAEFRKAFKAELGARLARAKAAKKAARMTSPINRFKITKGGPFVIGGRITQVRTGGVVTDKTHDLGELTRQRIEYEPLRGKLVLAEGTLGRPITVIVEDPGPSATLSGDASE